jgi:hypothetical protein
LYTKGDKLHWGVKKIRKYVCGDGSDVHAEELMKFGVLERLQFFLDETTETNVLFEILWILTNIAAGPTGHTTYLVEKGFLLPLGKLLNHPLGSIRTQAAWAIGNIIGDREGYRDLVLEAGLLSSILQIWKGAEMDEDSQRESFRISLWIVDNMCRYKPNWLLMKPAFEIIPMVLQQDDPSILKECCWAVARILHQSGRNHVIDAMITPQFCSRLIEILRWNRPLTTHPILRALINLASSKNPLHLKVLFFNGVYCKCWVIDRITRLSQFAKIKSKLRNFLCTDSRESSGSSRRCRENLFLLFTMSMVSQDDRDNQRPGTAHRNWYMYTQFNISQKCDGYRVSICNIVS